MLPMLKVGTELPMENHILILESDGVIHEHISNEEFLDRTDFQQRAFRYPL